MGERALNLANQTDEDLMHELLPVLNSMFQQTILQKLGCLLEVKDIRAFHKTRWQLDPLFYGGFSTWRNGYTEEDQARISMHYGNLVFSGEHTCKCHYGYTHEPRMRANAQR